MSLSSVASRVSVTVALAAFALTCALSLLAEVEALHAMLRGIAAFAGVYWLARWSAGVLEALGG